MKFSKLELDNEIWKDIKEFEGRYQVSNLGRIARILKNDDGKTLIINILKYGSKTCVLSRPIGENKFFKKQFVKKTLIYDSFSSKPRENFQIKFKDNNPKNLRFKNLERSNKFNNIDSPLLCSIKEFKESIITDFKENNISVADLSKKYKLSRQNLTLYLNKWKV